MLRSLLALACAATLGVGCSGVNSDAPPNRPPRCAGDSWLAVAAVPVVLPVLSNDADPDGDALVLIGASSPAHGTATPNADGTITYTADPGYRGADDFQYTVSDGRGGTASGIVALAVHVIPNEEVWTPVGAFPTSPVAIPDDASGVIAAWMEMRPEGIDLRAHRPGRWGTGGVLVGTIRGAGATYANPLPAVQIAPDGDGGAILAWSDDLHTTAVSLFAQRIAADGTVRWAAGGIPVCADGDGALVSWRDFSLASDGAGGAVVAWVTGNVEGSFVAAQRLAASDGAPLWGPCGTRVSPTTQPPGIYGPKLVTDGAGGVIATWYRVAGGAIVAQRLDADGTALWSDSGVLLLDAGSDHDTVPDGAGGAIVASTAASAETAVDILAQRVDASGALLWTAAGVTVTAAAGVQQFPTLAADGSGGAMIAWLDSRGYPYDAGDLYAPAIYAQRITASGSTAWTADGVPVCGNRVPLVLPAMQVTADGTGGAIVAWTDERDGANDSNLFAQRLAAGDGAALWATGGMHVTDAPGFQSAPRAVPDGAGGAILVFVDARTSTNRISSQRVAFDGSLP